MKTQAKAHLERRTLEKSGFTLIELLVVIAIITILASILFPVFARARENARRSSCSSNLKQLGIGVSMYAQDYDEFLPPHAYSDATTPNESRYNIPADDEAVVLGVDTAGPSPFLFWMNLVYPYVKSEAMLRCPTMSAKHNNYKGNYGANNLVIRSNAGKTMPQSMIQNASLTYMLFDSGSYSLAPANVLVANANFNYLPGVGALGVAPFVGSPANKSTLPSLVQDLKIGRHFGGVNVTFADGHVKWLKTSVLFAEAKKAGSPASCARNATFPQPHASCGTLPFGYFDPANS
jgi:prepilin-type N-terminal cleavage/methylation domain-containing protein/prepilin-type processing-associated H-X9-DG protein